MQELSRSRPMWNCRTRN